MMIVTFGLAGLAIFSFGFLVAMGWLGRRYTERIIDIPRLVEVPTPMGTCTSCGERLRPGPPYQLYLELNDCHGRQRAKWPVGRGERQVQAVQAADRLGVARVNSEVWAAVVRCNGIDLAAEEAQYE